MPSLLSIIELGGYPNLQPLYKSMGFDVEVLTSQRKARSYLKTNSPDVIVAEYNAQSDFRDRSSNLETLVAVLQKKSATKLLVFYMPEQQDRFDVFCQSHQVDHAIAFPITEEKVQAALTALG
jgi:hypothetical protein